MTLMLILKLVLMLMLILTLILMLMLMLMLILIFDATDTENQRTDGTGERRVERRKADKGIFDQLPPCFFFQICFSKVSKNFHF